MTGGAVPVDELEPGPPVEVMMAHELAAEVDDFLYLAAEISDLKPQRDLD